MFALILDQTFGDTHLSAATCLLVKALRKHTHTCSVLTPARAGNKD